ncbi:MAG: MazG nucleotide pyrophosphohydrolase domain-containing protein, partial [Pseudohongiellaceae bacterium]
MSNTFDPASESVQRLLQVMAMLRDPQHGCPWDLKQNLASLTRYTLEEVYEVVDAIENNATGQLRDELGDLLFQIIFYARIAEENGLFDFAGISDAITDKLIRRHPHVFPEG